MEQREKKKELGLEIGMQRGRMQTGRNLEPRGKEKERQDVEEVIGKVGEATEREEKGANMGRGEPQGPILLGVQD